MSVNTCSPDTSCMDIIRRLKSSTTARCAFVVVASLIAIWAAIAEPSRPSGNLPLLLDDPIAEVEVSSGTLVWSSQEDDGTTLGKPTAALVSRRFKPAETHTLEQVRDELASRAEEFGWQIEATHNHENELVYRATKSSADVELNLSISIGREEDVWMFLRVA